MGEKSYFNFQFVLGWMLFLNIYSTDHILKNMLMKLKKYFDGNFLFRLSLEQVNVGGGVEEGLCTWFTQPGLPLKGVYDKSTYIFVEPLLCMIDAGKHWPLQSARRNSVGVGAIVIPIL